MALGNSNAKGNTSSSSASSGSAKGTSSSGMGSMASAMGAAGGPAGNGNAGGKSGGSTSGNSMGGSSAGSSASNAAAGTTGNSKQNNGTNAANAGTQSSSATSTTSGVMGGLQSAVSAARDARNQNISGTQRGIANAVANAFGASQAASPNQGVTAPNATPGQKDAYNSGYRNETYGGMTRTAFGALPGVSSLIGEGISRTALSAPSNLADNEKSAYASGVTGAKDAGIGNTARTAGTLVGSVLGGPIGSALASIALGGYSYAQQRAANPQAFAGEAMNQSQGPVTGSMVAALGNGNANSATVAPTIQSNGFGTVAADNFGTPSDYGQAYNSYQNMNLGYL